MTDLIDDTDDFDKIALNSTKSLICLFGEQVNILEKSSLPPSDEQQEEEDCFEASLNLICSVLFQIDLAMHWCGGTSYMDSSWILNMGPVRVLLLALSALIKRRDKSISSDIYSLTEATALNGLSTESIFGITNVYLLCCFALIPTMACLVQPA